MPVMVKRPRLSDKEPLENPCIRTEAPDNGACVVISVTCPDMTPVFCAVANMQGKNIRIRKCVIFFMVMLKQFGLTK